MVAGVGALTTPQPFAMLLVVAAGVLFVGAVAFHALSRVGYGEV